jgi:hypothetical protein
MQLELNNLHEEVILKEINAARFSRN